MRDHETRIGNIEDWRQRMDGRLDMLRLIFGVSVLGALLAGLSLIVTITGHIR